MINVIKEHCWEHKRFLHQLKMSNTQKRKEIQIEECHGVFDVTAPKAIASHRSSSELRNNAQMKIFPFLKERGRETGKHGNQNMEVKTWKSKYGSQNMEVKISKQVILW